MLYPAHSRGKGRGKGNQYIAFHLYRDIACREAKLNTTLYLLTRAKKMKIDKSTSTGIEPTTRCVLYLIIIINTFADVGDAVHLHRHGEQHGLRRVALRGQLAVLELRPHVREQHARVHGGGVRRQHARRLRLLGGRRVRRGGGGGRGGGGRLGARLRHLCVCV